MSDSWILAPIGFFVGIIISLIFISAASREAVFQTQREAMQCEAQGNEYNCFDYSARYFDSKCFCISSNGLVEFSNNWRMDKRK